MGIEQYHDHTPFWNYLQDNEYLLSYQFLETCFIGQAIIEGVLTDKQNVKIKKIDVDDARRILRLETEIYNLREN
jgi:hypothetical protein